MFKPPRRMREHEIEALLARDLPAHLATLDRSGFPHVTPLWFLWADGAFHLSSLPDRPHPRRLQRDSRAGICVDSEDAERDDGERPNRQIRAVGAVLLSADHNGEWTRRILEKYLSGPAAEDRARGRASEARVTIHFLPVKLIAVASV